MAGDELPQQKQKPHAEENGTVHSGLERGASVIACRSVANCAGVSAARHSSSLRAICNVSAHLQMLWCIKYIDMDASNRPAFQIASG